MDMPQDTPIKRRRSVADEFSQQFQGTDQNFSSFESNPKNLQGSSCSIDEDGFKNMHIYREKQLAFPEVPSNLAKLYQIYIHNVTRKQELKKAIQVLIEKQIKALRIAYDKDNFSIQEIIDLDEESNEYKLSKKNYEERKAQLQKLARHYRELKIMHVEGMMVLDPIMKNTLDSYTQKNKEIIYLNVNQDTVFALCKQKFKPRKIRKLKNKKGTKKNINQQTNKSQQELEEESLNALQKGIKNKNASQTVSSEDEDQEQDQDQKIHQKFIFRSFKFFKTQNGVSFEPFQQLLELPSDKDYKGFVVEPTSKNYFAYQQKKMYILTCAQKQLKVKAQLSFDRKLIFCDILKNSLYIGTQDGLIRVYDIKQDCNLTLNKIVLCSYGNDEQITHFALTNNPDIIVFVKKGMDLCEMNLVSYSGYLLSHLQEPIEFIDNRLILTKSCVYLDYHASGGSHGKAILQHNQKLKKASKNRKIVKYYKHNQTDYAIFDEGAGVFSVENFPEVLKK